MSFEWRDYLNLAELLGADDFDEAKLRAAISRAYYGALCEARNFIESESNDSLRSGERTHWRIREAFLKAHEQDYDDIAEYLRTMEIQRNRADYDDAFTRTDLIRARDKVLVHSDQVFLDLAKLHVKRKATGGGNSDSPA